MCGVSPVEYSSGRRTSRRLNHGGDRQAKNRPVPDRVHPAVPRPAHPGVLPTPHSGGQNPA
ncbi:hypothetical protein [Streptomyces sp. Ag109_O5-1]|uniref:hypothetical protein n=1 Tax=Streptomyces sp. Ag109_O5-1 TaxID=1938851 RepID=UPI0021A96E7A|nr:hypothetical protein [Streptomyces sp. Ag109_O5-1]